MRYLTCLEASKYMDITSRRIQQMCKNGEIPGAIKKGRLWMIPSDVVPNADAHIFSQCGHWSQVEKADEFNTVIKNYLAVHGVK